MSTSRARSAVALAAFAALGLAGCSSNSTSPEDRLAHTWEATSFIALSQDFVLEGMELSITFSSSGTYTLTVANDLIGACDQGLTCTQTGTYAATSSQITLDPGDVESETVFDYTLSGSTLVLTGEIDGNPVTATFAKA